MNATNRVVGRTALVLVGLALLVLGVGAILVQTLPWAATAWHERAGVLDALGADAPREASVTAWTWVVGGAVVAARGRTALLQRIQSMNNLLGTSQSPHDCFLVLRGLKTLLLRMKAHEVGAAAVAVTAAGTRSLSARYAAVSRPRQ